MVCFFGWGSIEIDAASVVDSGTCGQEANWELVDEGTLTISGSGAMADKSKLFRLRGTQ